MNRFAVVGAVFLALIFGALILTKSPTQSIIDQSSEPYRLFRIENESCNVFYKECTCTGEVLVMESYPPQYNCQGKESCKDIQDVECN